MKSKLRRFREEFVRIARSCAFSPEDIRVYTGRAWGFLLFLPAANIQIKKISNIKNRHIEIYFCHRYRSGVTSKKLRDELETLRQIFIRAGRPGLVSERNDRLSYSALNIADIRPVVVCPYCNNSALLAKGSQIHFKSYYFKDNKYYWICQACEAWVGCHKNSGRPMGIPAKSDLRKMRKKVHLKYEYYLNKEKMSRNEAYLWFCRKLNCNICECHIGYFDEAMCIRALGIFNSLESVSNDYYPADSF
ncbi:zinc-finger-containing protein [Klebsiella oxytoca]|uniref:zinc-finger-containing protein n=1 Tax=Klebsiella oxytoca TaxID=571 RepID=UPI00384B7281